MACKSFLVAADEEDIELAGPERALLGEVEVCSGNRDAERSCRRVGNGLGADRDFAGVHGLPDYGLRETVFERGWLLVVLVAGAIAERDVASGPGSLTVRRGICRRRVPAGREAEQIVACPSATTPLSSPIMLLERRRGVAAGGVGNFAKDALDGMEVLLHLRGEAAAAAEVAISDVGVHIAGRL